jgi:acyl-CoA dehydrogenase
MALDRDTLAQLLDTVERFVTERLRPLEERVAEEDRIPPDIVAEMRGLGLFGLSIPEEHGGLGLTMSEEAQVAFRLGRTSPAFRSLIGTNNGIGSQGIVIDGTPEQKAHWLPRMASGEIVGSFCLTEPEAGSDAGSLRTSARRDGNDAYVTPAPSASSPTRLRPGSSRSLPAPIRKAPTRAASALSWSRRKRRGSRSARPTRRWARRARRPAT